MTKVKICGITNLEDALLSVKFGADALGFNFYEKSPRYISPQAAADIVDKLPGNAMKVGVFVNIEPYRIDEFVELVGLNIVQLHGDEDAKFVIELRAETNAKIIKAFRVSSDFQADCILGLETDGVLLDAHSADQYGGTGTHFDWEIARTVKDLCPELYLAGGLTSGNVAAAVKFVEPFAVDVASGVESYPGKKDPTKLEAFIKNAKNA